MASRLVVLLPLREVALQDGQQQVEREKRAPQDEDDEKHVR